MGHKDYFPFDIRPEQDKLLDDCIEAVTNKKILIANAPTGLGKTVATISSVLYEAIRNDYTVFFVTSRHTQHKIVIDTLRVIKEKFNLDFKVCDFIGKMWMCAVPGVSVLSSSEFSEYCKTMVENGKCSFYTKTKSKTKVSVEAKKLVEDIEKMEILDVDSFKEKVCEQEMCPFEIACEYAKNARVVIADYYHVFRPSIRQAFFKRIEKSLSDCIIIVDEAHNLPYRVRDLASSKLSSFVVNRAISEAKMLDRLELTNSLSELLEILSSLCKDIKGYETEKYVKSDDFLSRVNIICDDDIETFIKHLYAVSEEILEEKKVSYLALVADFLTAFSGPDMGFSRILTKSRDAKGREMITISYSCLDPSLVTKQAFSQVQSAIIMSGTLHPPEMYRDLLGISPDKCDCKAYKSPFDERNRLSLVIPKTSAKYTMREPAQYEHIAKICAECCNEIVGNVAIFVPSYSLLENISKYFSVLSKKSIFYESSGLSKFDRETILSNFKKYSKKGGAVLFGVSGGSFSEGIDLPGDELLGVIIVGLPLSRPDLETQATIDYYDNLFGRGFDYGYTYPAFNKVLQGAGRCIRTQSDRGVLIFLDERYVWKNYYKCFPEYLNVRVVSEGYVEMIREFFSRDFLD